MAGSLDTGGYRVGFCGFSEISFVLCVELLRLVVGGTRSKENLV